MSESASTASGSAHTIAAVATKKSGRRTDDTPNSSVISSQAPRQPRTSTTYVIDG
jgi:hypothetical protein